MAKAKPFIKWVGGKSQLIEQLDALLPAEFDYLTDVTYIEPFVGGGAMLFYMLQRYPNIRQAVINDINPDLATCYRTVRDSPEELIASLRDIENEYKSLETEDAKKDFYMAVRSRYNVKDLGDVENTTKFFFLNRTIGSTRRGFLMCRLGSMRILRFATPSPYEKTAAYSNAWRY